MRLVLAAIKRAGRLAPDRASFLKTFLSLGEIHGVIGDYRFNANGDTSLTAFDAYRVGAAGALTLLARCRSASAASAAASAASRSGCANGAPSASARSGTAFWLSVTICAISP